MRLHRLFVSERFMGQKRFIGALSLAWLTGLRQGHNCLLFLLGYCGIAKNNESEYVY